MFAGLDRERLKRLATCPTNRALRVLAGEALVRVEPGAVVVLAPELLAARAKAGLELCAPGDQSKNRAR